MHAANLLVAGSRLGGPGSNRLQKLAHRFRQQELFAAEYSPLYACLFGTLADWLREGDDDPLVAWLLSASDKRNTLDVTLLLLAGLHRDILEEIPAVAPLARYYPTVGGDASCRDNGFEPSLRQSIMARRPTLSAFIQEATVQTNETGRGIAWLLPLHFTGWKGIHLIDLGASAGLNLVADLRAYRLVDAGDGRSLLDVGQGKTVQFVVKCHGDAKRWLDTARTLPHILSRTGCDVAPFRLETTGDEKTLASFIWGDQPHRLQRLREGVDALRSVKQDDAPLQLYAVDLPDELSRFLSRQVPTGANWPVVIYNTYMTVYLKDRGSSLRGQIQNWAALQNRPVLWLQWEPEWGESEPPEFGWCAWTADLWRGGDHRQWRLGWVQPHGTDVHWLRGFEEWIEFWRHLPI